MRLPAHLKEALAPRVGSVDRSLPHAVPILRAMTDDDWAPLPEGDLCARPGEVADVARRLPTPTAMPVPVAAPAPAMAPAPKVEDPRAEPALAELKRKLQQTPKGRSLIAAVQQREQKCARRERAAAAEPLRATMVTMADDPTQRPQLAYAVGADGRDEREESEWFRGLPAAEQERLHQSWAGKRAHATDSAMGQRRVANRRMVASLFVFGATIVLGSGAFWHATLGASIVCGIWWRYAAPDRFMDPIRAIVTLFGLQGTAMLVQGASNPSMFMDAVLVVAFAAFVGFASEIRRTGGFDAQ